jgi:hypothetical protein
MSPGVEAEGMKGISMRRRMRRKDRKRLCENSEEPIVGKSQTRNTI